MQSVARWVSALAAFALLSVPASAGPPPSARPAVPTTTASPSTPCPEATGVETGADEQRAFEAEAERYLRFAELTRRLAEEVEREREQTFDAEVDLYVKKRELTRSLAARNGASAPSTSAPAW